MGCGAVRATGGAAHVGFAAVFSLLAAVGLLALLHRFSGGALLASRPLTVAGLLLVWTAVGVAGRGHWPRGGAAPHRAWLAIAAAGVSLVWATWWGDPGGLPGDYTQHRMYTYQLLNGFAAPHVPYAGVPSHYTFLQSTLIAVWMQCTGLSFHYAALGFACALSAVVAWLAHDVALRSGLGGTGAFFFAGLVVAYGGMWFVGLDEFFLYLPGVQLAMPFVARNLALLLVLLLVWLAQAAARGEVGAGAAAIGAGVLVGLLGLTRPWEFVAALLGLFGWAVHTRSRAGWAGVALALTIASGYFAPLVVAWWELGVHATREVERPVHWPTSPYLYLPLLVFVLPSLRHWRDAPPMVRGCGWALAATAVATGLGMVAGALGGGGRLQLEGGLLKLDRVGQWVALPLFALAAHGLDTLRGRIRPLACAVVLVIGFVTTIRVTSAWLDGEPTWLPERWRQPPTWVFGLEGSRLYLRNWLDDPRAVVMAPPALGEFIARANGVDVVYSRTAVPIWRDRPAGPWSQSERRDLAEAFYGALREGRIDGALLRAVDARWFLAPVPIDSEHVEEVASVGQFAGSRWRLYRLSGVSRPESR